MKDLLNVFFSCPKCLESTLANELKELAKPETSINVGDGGCSVRMDFEDLTKCMLNSKIASRAFLYLTGFNFHNEKEIYKNLISYSWEKVLNTDQTFKFSTLLDFAASRYFKNSMILSLLAKDALADWFRSKKGKRPDVATNNPDASFLLRIEDDTKRQSWRLSLFVDLCGSPLSNRGYRKDQYLAPLRENLAAGILQNTDWDGQEYFIDPMCGSGTLLIEAIYHKAKLPGAFLKIQRYLKYREKIWSMLDHNWFLDSSEYKTQFQELIEQTHQKAQNSLDSTTGLIYGSDIANSAITETKETINKIKFNDFIKLERADATKISAKATSGIVVCNPPYGERLNTQEEAQTLIHNFGENLKANFKGFRAYMILEHGPLKKSISLRTSKSMPLYNGNIECRLLRYNLY